jgi:hypothetical protein
MPWLKVRTPKNLQSGITGLLEEGDNTSPQMAMRVKSFGIK